jgi:hypothetical protein
MRGTNTASVTNTIDIAACLRRRRSLSVKAISNADLYAKTYADGGGFFSGSKLKASNTLTRSTTINIGDSSDLSADFGSLTVKAAAGVNDDIYTYARISSGGVVALGNAEANGTVKLLGEREHRRGRKPARPLQYAEHLSDSSIGSFSASVEVNTSGLGVCPQSK